MKPCGKKSIFATVTIRSVSYTHLDVYKRQHLQIGQATATLSGGENIRIKIMKASKSTAKVIGVDEPFKGLSNIEIDAVANYLNRIREKGKTLIVIDHSTGVEDYFSQWIQIENIDNRLIGKRFK